MDKENYIKNDSFKSKDEAEQKKLKFFWYHCTPDAGNVVDSIREKTFRKIHADIEKDSVISTKKRYSKRYLMLTAVAAAAVIVFVARWMLYESSPHEGIKEIAGLMAVTAVDSIKEITLILPDRENIQLEENVEVKYSLSGLLSINSQTITNNSQSKVNENKNNGPEYNQLIVPNGKRAQLLLADGTKLWVNSGSKVIYPKLFQGKKREIFVEGEVYLEVAHNAEKPFIVNTSGFDVKVLGTAFNICAYKKMKTCTVALVEGNVEIKDRHNVTVNLKPDELASIENEGIKEKIAVNAKDYMAWINGNLILNGEYLNDLTGRLSLYYGKEIVCCQSLREEQVYGKLNLRDDFHEVLGFIKEMIPSVSVKETDGVIYLQRE